MVIVVLIILFTRWDYKPLHEGNSFVFFEFLRCTKTKISAVFVYYNVIITFMLGFYLLTQ